VPIDLDSVPAQVRDGRTDAFRMLVDELGPTLVRLASRIVGDVPLAEDVVQEGLLKAYRAMVDGAFEARASVRTWLYRIVTNSAIDMRRRRRRVLLEQALDDTTPAITVDADQRLALRERASWLDELPDAQRATLVLSAFDGLSQREIAEIQGCSEGAVEQRLVRARATLRAKIRP
jgi:RNA polymerase sigma-70 factor (ECF subfamily)